MAGWRVITLGILLLAMAVPSLGTAQSNKQPTYKERLILGLRARRPSEVEFIDAVVDTVNRGELPRRLVDRTYFWARQRSPKKGGRKARRAIIYFQPALTLQAEKIGAKIAKS